MLQHDAMPFCRVYHCKQIEKSDIVVDAQELNCEDEQCITKKDMKKTRCHALLQSLLLRADREVRYRNTAGREASQAGKRCIDSKSTTFLPLLHILKRPIHQSKRLKLKLCLGGCRSKLSKGVKW